MPLERTRREVVLHRCRCGRCEKAFRLLSALARSCAAALEVRFAGDERHGPLSRLPLPWVLVCGVTVSHSTFAPALWRAALQAPLRRRIVRGTVVDWTCQEVCARPVPGDAGCERLCFFQEPRQLGLLAGRRLHALSAPREAGTLLDQARKHLGRTVRLAADEFIWQGRSTLILEKLMKRRPKQEKRP